MGSRWKDLFSAEHGFVLILQIAHCEYMSQNAALEKAAHVSVKISRHTPRAADCFGSPCAL